MCVCVCLCVEQLSIRALQRCGDVEAEGAVWGMLAQVYSRLYRAALGRHRSGGCVMGGGEASTRAGPEAQAVKLLCITALGRHRDIGLVDSDIYNPSVI